MTDLCGEKVDVTMKKWKNKSLIIKCEKNFIADMIFVINAKNNTTVFSLFFFLKMSYDFLI